MSHRSAFRGGTWSLMRKPHPKTGEKRVLNQPLKIDRLPAETRGAIQTLRAQYTWQGIEELSAMPFNAKWRTGSGGFVDWDALPLTVQEIFPRRRLAKSSLHLWFDLRVRQATAGTINFPPGRPLKIDRLPAEVRVAIRLLRDWQYSWQGIGELSALPFNPKWKSECGGFVDWNRLPVVLQKLFPNRRLPYMTLRKWFILRVLHLASETGRRPMELRLKIDQLPAEVRSAIEDFRAAHFTWQRIEELSGLPFNPKWRTEGGGFVNWDGLSIAARRLFPKRRLSRSTLHSWFGLRVCLAAAA